MATADDDGKLDPAIVSALFQEHADELQRFVAGILRDGSLAHDVVQATFAKLLEVGHETRTETRKAWLFRVAYHEALVTRRRQAISERANQALAWMRNEDEQVADAVLRSETEQQVRDAVRQLPLEQRMILERRIYEDRTFADIAAELRIPLGTALARMRSALRRLRDKLS